MVNYCSRYTYRSATYWIPIGIQSWEFLRWANSPLPSKLHPETGWASRMSNIRRNVEGKCWDGSKGWDFQWVTQQGINISHLGKRKIIFKMAFLGDMFFSWRVLLTYLVGGFNPFEDISQIECFFPKIGVKIENI